MGLMRRLIDISLGIVAGAVGYRLLQEYQQEVNDYIDADDLENADGTAEGGETAPAEPKEEP